MSSCPKDRDQNTGVCKPKSSWAPERCGLEIKGFADNYVSSGKLKSLFPYQLASFSAPIMNPSSQSHLYENKIHNLRLAGRRFNGLIIGPGQICSFWHKIGQPNAANGFLEAAILVNGKLATSMGGSICQLSGVLYNVALMSNLTILERHSHSVDAYGDARYVPLGRDATLVYGKKDVAFYNSQPFPVAISVYIDKEKVMVRSYLRTPPPFWGVELNSEEISVVPPEITIVPDNTIDADYEMIDHPGYWGRIIDTHRTVKYNDGSVVTEFLGRDKYRMMPKIIRRNQNFQQERVYLTEPKSENY